MREIEFYEDAFLHKAPEHQSIVERCRMQIELPESTPPQVTGRTLKGIMPTFHDVKLPPSLFA